MTTVFAAYSRNIYGIFERIFTPAIGVHVTMVCELFTAGIAVTLSNFNGLFHILIEYINTIAPEIGANTTHNNNNFIGSNINDAFPTRIKSTTITTTNKLMRGAFSGRGNSGTPTTTVTQTQTQHTHSCTNVG